MNFIKKINTYLLEQYPTIWNTRLVWMLLVGAISHLLFFAIGYFSVSNRIDIQSEYRLDQFYFGTSVVFFNILLSIIILLIWIIYYLQNNAFKNLYTLKKGNLFSQLLIILVVIFINITQYFSFHEGLSCKIRNLYSWEEVDADIKEFNKTAIFLIQNPQEYDINHKQYPAPFPLQYESRDVKNVEEFIDTTKAYFIDKGVYYQFYKINKALISEDSGLTQEANIFYNNNKGYDINRNTNFKYRIVKDVEAFKEDIAHCLLNYSSILYRYGQDSTAYKQRLKYYENVFKRGDENEIKNNLQSFLKLAEKYEIEHNLNIEEWFGLLNENNYEYREEIVNSTSTENTYEVKRFYKARKNYRISQYILKRKPSEYNREKHHYTKIIKVPKRIIHHGVRKSYHETDLPLSISKTDKKISEYEEVKLSNIPYCDFKNVDRFFKNTYDAYESKSKLEAVYVYLVIALFFGLLLFLFKVTDIKTLLLSFVGAAVVLIISGLLIAYFPRYMHVYSNSFMEYLIAFIIGVTVITTSIIALNARWNKLITAILFSLAIFAIPLTLMFLFLMYERSVNYDLRSKDILLLWLKDNVFWLIILIWLITIAGYTKAIRKWKGLPA